MRGLSCSVPKRNWQRTPSNPDATKHCAAHSCGLNEGIASHGGLGQLPAMASEHTKSKACSDDAEGRKLLRAIRLGSSLLVDGLRLRLSMAGLPWSVVALVVFVSPCLGVGGQAL